MATTGTNGSNADGRANKMENSTGRSKTFNPPTGKNDQYAPPPGSHQPESVHEIKGSGGSQRPGVHPSLR